MLHIKIIPQFFLHSAFRKQLRCNPEFLRYLDKKDITIYINPYRGSDWFRENIINPTLGDDGYIRAECWDVEFQSNGISFILERPSEKDYELFTSYHFCADEYGRLSTPNGRVIQKENYYIKEQCEWRRTRK